MNDKRTILVVGAVHTMRPILSKTLLEIGAGIANDIDHGQYGKVEIVGVDAGDYSTIERRIVMHRLGADLAVAEALRKAVKTAGAASESKPFRGMRRRDWEQRNRKRRR